MFFSPGFFSFLSLHWSKARGHLNFAEIFKPRSRISLYHHKVDSFFFGKKCSVCVICCAEKKKRRCSKSMVIRASLFGVGAPEALVIGVVALLVFGPKGLAEVSGVLCDF